VLRQRALFIGSKKLLLKQASELIKNCITQKPAYINLLRIVFEDLSMKSEDIFYSSLYFSVYTILEAISHFIEDQADAIEISNLVIDSVGQSEWSFFDVDFGYLMIYGITLALIVKLQMINTLDKNLLNKMKKIGILLKSKSKKLFLVSTLTTELLKRLHK